MKHNLAKVTHFAAELLLRIAAFGLVLMTVIVGWQVFGRYVLNSSPSWSEQAALTLMIWYVLLAAAAGVREGFHIRIVALEEAVGPKAKRGMRMVQDLIVASCGIAMTIWGGELVIRTWEHIIPSLGLPRGLSNSTTATSWICATARVHSPRRDRRRATMSRRKITSPNTGSRIRRRPTPP